MKAWCSRVVGSAVSLLLLLCVPLAAGAEQITLQYWERNWKPEVDATTEIIARFEEEHPEIKIERVLVDLGEWETKMRVAVASGAAIDLIDVGSVVNYSEAGLLLPLDKYVDRNGDWWQDIVPPYREFLTHEGTIWAAPWQDHSRAIIYDASLMEKAGIMPPQDLADAWTWDEAIKVAKRLTQTDGEETKVWGLLTPFRWPHESRADNFRYIMWQFGADVLNEDFTEVTFDSPEAIEALELVHSWFYEHEISPPITGAQPNYPTDYYSGKVAMVIEGNWAISVWEQADAYFGTTPLPQGPVPAAPSGGWLRGICANSRHPDAAWEFLRYLTNTESLITLHRHTGHLAPRRSTALALADRLLSQPFKVFQQQAMEIGHQPQDMPVMGKIMGHLNNAVVAVLKNEVPARTALRDAARKAQTVLDEFNAKKQ